MCSASLISQIYCSCERQLCLSCSARLASNTRCKITLRYRISARQHTLVVQRFLYWTCFSETTGTCLEAASPPAMPYIPMTADIHMFMHPQPSTLGHIHLCVDHVHIRWQSGLYAYSTIIAKPLLYPELLLHMDEKNHINVQEILLRPFHQALACLELLR